MTLQHLAWTGFRQWLVLCCLCVSPELCAEPVDVFGFGTVPVPPSGITPLWHFFARHKNFVCWNCSFQPKLKAEEKPRCEAFSFQQHQGAACGDQSLILQLHSKLPIYLFSLYFLLIPFSHKYCSVLYHILLPQQAAEDAGGSGDISETVWMHFWERGKEGKYEECWNRENPNPGSITERQNLQLTEGFWLLLLSEVIKAQFTHELSWLWAGWGHLLEIWGKKRHFNVRQHLFGLVLQHQCAVVQEWLAQWFLEIFSSLSGRQGRFRVGFGWNFLPEGLVQPWSSHKSGSDIP